MKKWVPKKISPSKWTLPKNKDWTMEVIFLVLNTVAVGVSGYQTWLGYQKVVAGGKVMSFALAFITVIMFFALNIMIKKRLESGKSVALWLFGYLVPLGMSFSGNFNALISTQIKDEYFIDEMTIYQDSLDRNYEKAVGILDDELKEFIDDSTTMRDDLLYKIIKESTNAGGSVTGVPGWGSLSNQRWQEYVNKVNSLPCEVSIDPQVNADIKYYKKKGSALVSYRIQVENTLYSEHDRIMAIYRKYVEDAVRYRSRLAKVQSNYAEGSSLVDSLRSLSEQDPDECILALRKMRDANNRMLDQLEGLADYNTDKIKGMYLENSKAINYLTPRWTLEQITSFKYRAAVVFGLVLSLVLDLGCLLFIFLAFSSNGNNDIEFYD